MIIVYIILAHQYPTQLLRLITQLDSNGASFFVHVDQKTEELVYQEMAASLQTFPNVHFLRRHKVYWGDFSQISATLEGLHALFSNDIAFDYVKILTGQCYPLKSTAQIKNMLAENNGQSFIEYFPLPYKGWEKGGEKNGGLDRVTYWYIQILGRRLRLPVKRALPNGVKPFGGSAYWCLSRECAQFVYEFIKKKPSLMNFFKFVNLPDEIFFQTIILNSPFQKKIINDDLTYTEWVWNSPNPKILDTNSFEALAVSSCLFARKFDVTIDSEILDLIDQRLLQP